MDHNSSKRRHKPIQPPSPSSEDDAARKASVFRRLGSQREIVLPHPIPHKPSPHVATSSRPECRHWMARGRCDFGSACSFSHPPLPPPPVHNSPPKKYVRSPSQRPSQEFSATQQEDLGRIRSAVVVSKSEHRSTRKVTIPDEADPDITRNSNYEFESALALEKERQYLQRRIDALNEIVPDKPKKPSSRSRKHELREEPTSSHQQFMPASESNDEPKGTLDYPEDHRSPYHKQPKRSLKSVGFPANRQFPPTMKGHYLRGRHPHLDINKEEGELSDDPEKREARREKMRQQEKEFKEMMKKRVPKTPPEIEIEPPSPGLRTSNRSKGRYGSTEQSKTKNNEEMIIGMQRSPSEQRRGIKRQHFETIRDDPMDQRRPKMLAHQQRDLDTRPSPILDEEPAPRIRRQQSPPIMKGMHDRRDPMKQAPMRQISMKREHNYQDLFRRKYEQYGQRRFNVGQPVDPRRKMPTRPVFEKRPEDQMERRRRKEFRPITPPPMAPPQDRGWKKSPIVRGSQFRPMERRHLQHNQSPLKMQTSPVKIRQFEEDHFENQRYLVPKSPIRDFPESENTYAQSRRHRSKDGRRSSSKLIRSADRTKERSYPASEKSSTSKLTRKDEQENKISPSRSINEKVFNSSSLSPPPPKRQEQTIESVVEKITTPENDDEETHGKTAEDMGGVDQDLEPISDEEVQEDVDKVAGIAECVDWSSLVKDTADETSSIKKLIEAVVPTTVVSSLDKFKPEYFLANLGLQKDLLGPELSEKIETLINSSKQTGETEFQLNTGATNLNRSKVSSVQKRLRILNDVGPFRKALSARSDLKMRRQLCGLYAEPYENLHTTEFNVPYNADSYETAKKLFLKRPIVVDSQAV